MRGGGRRSGSSRSLCHSGSGKMGEKLKSSLFLPPFSAPHSRYFHNLQNLSLAYCRKFTDKGLQYLNLGNGCHKLIYLDLSGCTQVCLPVSQAPPSCRGRGRPPESQLHPALMLHERRAQSPARSAEVLNYTSTAACIFSRVATIGAWLLSTGASHQQTGRARGVMTQTTSEHRARAPQS